MMTEWLLLETMADIERRVQSVDRYTVLGLAPLLRKLLVDGEPLLQAVRRNRRKPAVAFPLRPFVLPGEERDRDGWNLVLAYGNDELVGDADTGALSLKQFLAAPVAAWRGMPLSVLDVIKHYAHVEGGVHLGAPDGEFNQRLIDLFPPLYGRVRDPVQVMVPIARATLIGVQQLRDDVLTTPYRG